MKHELATKIKNAFMEQSSCSVSLQEIKSMTQIVASGIRDDVYCLVDDSGYLYVARISYGRDATTTYNQVINVATAKYDIYLNEQPVNITVPADSVIMDYDLAESIQQAISYKLQFDFDIFDIRCMTKIEANGLPSDIYCLVDDFGQIGQMFVTLVRHNESDATLSYKRLTSISVARYDLSDSDTQQKESSADLNDFIRESLEKMCEESPL